jgi:malate dehydrogenase
MPVLDAIAERLGGRDAATAWLDDVFIPRVAKRGAEIIEVRGSSSVASAANAAIDHVRDEQLGTRRGLTSAAVVSRGEYGVPEGLVCSFPVRSDGSGYRVVEGLALDDRSRRLIDASVAELESERDAVRELGLV